ncbi:hypothetical protein ACWPKO_09300 [Coraliomargarita sp. W4R53]
MPEHSGRGILLKCSLFIGLVLALSSCCWWFVLPVIELIQSDRGWGGYLATGILCLIFGIPGLLLLYTVNELRKKLDRHTIKNFCGVLYGMLMLLAGFGGLQFVMHRFGGTEAAMFTSGTLFMAIAGLLPIYVAHAKCLMREAGIVPQHGEFFGRSVLQLLAFLMGMSLMRLLGDSELMKVSGGVDSDKNQLQMAGFLAVLLVPYLLYKFSVRLLIAKADK